MNHGYLAGLRTTLRRLLGADLVQNAEWLRSQSYYWFRTGAVIVELYPGGKLVVRERREGTLLSRDPIHVADPVFAALLGVLMAAAQADLAV